MDNPHLTIEQFKELIALIENNTGKPHDVMLVTVSEDGGRPQILTTLAPEIQLSLLSFLLANATKTETTLHS